MPNACGFACVRALAKMSVSVCICFSVHVGVCVSECMMLRPQADACGLFAFGMDASQNTDISSEMSSPNPRLPWGTRQRGGVAGRAQAFHWTEMLDGQ